MNTAALHKAIAAVCPLDGVSVDHPADRSTWRIDFKDEATPEQRAAARAALDAFDPAAELVAEKPRDLAAEFDALKGALEAKAVLTVQDVSAIDTAAVSVKKAR